MIWFFLEGFIGGVVGGKKRKESSHMKIVNHESCELLKQIHREKVINQIEVDIQRAERTGEMLVYVGLKTAKDAIAMMKEQEARVMTREELKQFEGSPCWFESHGTYMGKEGFWIIPYMFTCYQTMYYVFPLLSANERGDVHYSELGLSAYNKAWRCWSAKPTDEQRKAVKWYA